MTPGSLPKSIWTATLKNIHTPENFLPLTHTTKRCNVLQVWDENLALFRTEYAVRVHRKEYFAITHHMDDQIDGSSQPWMRVDKETTPISSSPRITDWQLDAMA